MRGVSAARVGPIVRKEFRELRRDPRSLVFLVVMPVFLLVMYGYVLNFDVRHLPLAVVDLDRSQASRELVDRFSATEYFDFTGYLDRPGDIDFSMNRDRIKAALVIPAGFANDLAAGRSPAVQVIVDGTNSMTATTAMGYAAMILQDLSIRLTASRLKDRGLREVGLPVKSEVRVWFNPELLSARFLLPGLMSFLLMVIVVISTAFAVVREKERGTMEQILVSPVSPGELIVGKLIPYVLISLVAAHLVLLAGYGLFDVSVRGSYPLLLLFMAVFLVCGLGQGLLISTFARTQQVAFMMAVITSMLPSFILTGFIFPIREMPPAIQAVTYLVPGRYFLTALRSIILKGTGLGVLWHELVSLSVFAVLIVGLSAFRLKRSEFGAGEGRPRGRARFKRSRPEAMRIDEAPRT
jgi:ABC-2 type transport system permease protein